jgi:hypothetical protein
MQSQMLVSGKFNALLTATVVVMALFSSEFSQVLYRIPISESADVRFLCEGPRILHFFEVP